MESTVYNPQKGRLETLDVDYTDENTTWFKVTRNNSDIYMITDFQGGLLIRELGYSYPIWLYDISRADIGYSRKKAKQLRRQHE